MQKKKFTLLSLAVATMFAASSAAEAVVFEGSAIGSWTNPDATFGYTISNMDAGGEASVEWGDPAPGSFSNYLKFDGVGSDVGSWSTTEESLFLIGDFNYRNGSVYSSSNDFNGVDLSILLSITSPAGISDTFVFDFDITSTPNTTGDPVLDGDIVDITNPLNPTTFAYDGVQYTLALAGFSIDSGTTITTRFNSPEETIATAGVYAKIAIVSVPEPTTLVLIGFGLAGIGYRRGRLVA